jgi:3-methyladenine DNA glycosylase AlkD
MKTKDISKISEKIIYKPINLAEKTVNTLSKNAKDDVARSQQRFFKANESLKILGLNSAGQREIAKGLYKKVKGNWNTSQVMEFVNILISKPEQEAKSIAIIFLKNYMDTLPPNTIEAIERWIFKNYCNNWAIVDSLCLSIIAPLIDKYPHLIKRMVTWSDSDNLWAKRCSIVSLIKSAKLGENVDTILTMSRKFFNDTDDLIQKANGWLLRELGKSDMDRLEKFILEYGTAIPRTTLRYSIEEFPEDKRKQLLEKTRN